MNPLMINAHERVKETAQNARSAGRRVVTVEETWAIAGLPEEARR